MNQRFRLFARISTAASRISTAASRLICDINPLITKKAGTDPAFFKLISNYYFTTTVLLTTSLSKIVCKV